MASSIEAAMLAANRAGQADGGRSFADGMKSGMGLAARIASGDQNLAEQIRKLLEGQ